MHLVDTLALDAPIGFLDAASNTGICALETTTAVAVAACAALVQAAVTPSARAPLVAVGAALAFLAVDAPLAVHNRVGAAVAAAVAAPAATDDWPTPIVYAPLLAVVAVLVWRHPDRRDHRLAARAGLLVLGAALALRPLAFGAYLVWRARPRGVLRELAVAGQQGLELGGWILVGWALAAAALAAVRAAGARRVG